MAGIAQLAFFIVLYNYFARATNNNIQNAVAFAIIGLTDN